MTRNSGLWIRNLFNWVVPKCFHWTSWIQKQRFCRKSATLCAKYQDVTTQPKKHGYQTGSLNWLQFMLFWLIRFPELAENNECSAPFGASISYLSSENHNIIPLYFIMHNLPTELSTRFITSNERTIDKWTFLSQVLSRFPCSEVPVFLIRRPNFSFISHGFPLSLW